MLWEALWSPGGGKGLMVSSWIRELVLAAPPTARLARSARYWSLELWQAEETSLWTPLAGVSGL